MNWLAHLLLSEPLPDFQVGNLLPDLASPAVFSGLPVGFRRGIACHHRIDAYTDAHPIVRAGWGRFQAPLRRFAGVITDVLYDHFLTRHWSTFSNRPLPEFVGAFHAAWPDVAEPLPAEVCRDLARLRDTQLLTSYARLEGVEGALLRLSHRLRRPVDLAAAMPVIVAGYEEFEADFLAFFPQLQRHLEPSAAGESVSATSAVEAHGEEGLEGKFG